MVYFTFCEFEYDVKLCITRKFGEERINDSWLNVQDSQCYTQLCLTLLSRVFHCHFHEVRFWVILNWECCWRTPWSWITKCAVRKRKKKGRKKTVLFTPQCTCKLCSSLFSHPNKITRTLFVFLTTYGCMFFLSHIPLEKLLVFTLSFLFHGLFKYNTHKNKTVTFYPSISTTHTVYQENGKVW